MVTVAEGNSKEKGQVGGTGASQAAAGALDPAAAKALPLRGVAGLLVRVFVHRPDDVADPEVRGSYGLLASIASIVCNVALCLAKGVVGAVAGSVSIVADAVNNLSDAASNIVSLLGFKLAAKPADEGHPYGHGRFEYLAALVVAALVLAVGINLVAASIGKIAHPEPVEFGWAVVVVLVGSILVKLWMASLNRRLGRAISSEVLFATAVDARNDVIATAAVLACAVISHTTHLDLDGWAGAGVGVFVCVSGVLLLRDAVNPLLGSAPDPDLVERIRQRILSYPGVLGTHDLMVHDYGPGRRFASAHVEMAAETSPLASHEVLDEIEQSFKDRDHLVMTLHLDPIVTDVDATNDLHKHIAELARTIDPALTVHDVRTVTTSKRMRIVFDCVRPQGLALTDAELSARLVSAVETAYPGDVCSVTIDDGYLSAAQ